MLAPNEFMCDLEENGFTITNQYRLQPHLSLNAQLDEFDKNGIINITI